MTANFLAYDIYSVGTGPSRSYQDLTSGGTFSYSYCILEDQRKPLGITKVSLRDNSREVLNIIQLKLWPCLPVSHVLLN